MLIIKFVMPVVKKMPQRLATLWQKRFEKQYYLWANYCKKVQKRTPQKTTILYLIR
jgi:hypothetical protein